MSDEYHGDPNPEEVIEALQGITDVLSDAHEHYEPPAIQSDIKHGTDQELRELVELWKDYADDAMESDSHLIHGYGRGALTCAEELEEILDQRQDTEEDR